MPQALSMPGLLSMFLETHEHIDIWRDSIADGRPTPQSAISNLRQPDRTCADSRLVRETSAVWSVERERERERERFNSAKLPLRDT